MNIEQHTQKRGKKIIIEISGTDLNFREFELDTATPTGGKIAKVAGFNGGRHPFVLQWENEGDLEYLRVQEEADLQKGAKFIVAESDSSNRIAIDGNELDWPSDFITGTVVRRLGRIADTKTIYLERQDEPDRLIGEMDSIKIRAGGIEEFKSREPTIWELNVQGKKIKSNTPTISVVDALTRAGFDPNVWIIILKVEGQPKRQLSVNESIDLTASGIEKIRLTAKDVNNGEARVAPRRDFALLEIDENYLDELGHPWETCNDEGNRWLVIHDHFVPLGYTISSTTLALLIPPTYPQAEIDMFYVHPHLQKISGGVIEATQATQNIGGRVFQRWSRHRGPGSPWNPQKDNVVTHLALAESSIAKEVED